MNSPINTPNARLTGWLPYGLTHRLTRSLTRCIWGGTVVWLGITAPLADRMLQAHETEVEGQIAATWHVEPNDAPEAGKPAQVWVALTRSGGKVIPLADCDCTLKIWSVPPGTQPLLEPELTSISAEQYTGIPGAEVVFPDRGQYLLELSGSPKTGATFSPFTFKNQILVATGTPTETADRETAPPAATESPEPPEPIASETSGSPDLAPPLSEPTLNQSLPLIGLGAIVLLLGLGGMGTFMVLKNRLKNRQDGQKTPKTED
jgi:hypothetical protein